MYVLGHCCTFLDTNLFVTETFIRYTRPIKKSNIFPSAGEFLPRVNDDSVVIHRLIRVVVVKDAALAAVAYLHLCC